VAATDLRSPHAISPTPAGPRLAAWRDMATLSRAIRRKYRHRATVNMLHMGHCAPSVLKTLLEVTEQKDESAIKLACGMPGGIGNTGQECGAVTSSLVVLGMRHGMDMNDGLPEVVCRGQELCQRFLDRNGTLSCLQIRGGPDKLSTKCPKIVREAPEMFIESNDRDGISPSAHDAYAQLYAHFAKEHFHCAQEVMRRLRGEPVAVDGVAGFLGGTVFRGLTCSALAAGVMALGVRIGALEDSPWHTIKMAAIMLAGGNGLADHLNEFNRLTNRGHELAEWFEGEFGSTLCRAITRCDFASPIDVNRYIEGHCIDRCKTITAAVAQKVEAMTSAN
jgi:C_GCAxxG_C_C family probable redox protein